MGVDSLLIFFSSLVMKPPQYLLSKEYIDYVASIDPVVDSPRFERATNAWFRYLESNGIDPLDVLTGKLPRL
jgi:hypothetical protein